MTSLKHPYHQGNQSQHLPQLNYKRPNNNMHLAACRARLMTHPRKGFLGKSAMSSSRQGTVRMVALKSKMSNLQGQNALSPTRWCRAGIAHQK